MIIIGFCRFWQAVLFIFLFFLEHTRIYCESYLSNLSDSSGPWNQSMCSSELEKIHCQTGQIRRCVPFIPGDFFACCIKDPKGYTLKGTCL